MTVPDPLAGLGEPCGTCEGMFEVAWCPVWDVWLCTGCRDRRADREVRVTLEEKQAMQAAAEAA